MCCELYFSSEIQQFLPSSLGRFLFLCKPLPNCLPDSDPLDSDLELVAPDSGSEHRPVLDSALEGPLVLLVNFRNLIGAFGVIVL